MQGIRFRHQQGFMQLAVGHAADVFQNSFLHVDLGLKTDGALLVVDNHMAYFDAVLIQGFEFGNRFPVRKRDFPRGFLRSGSIGICGPEMSCAQEKPQVQASRAMVNFRNMFMELRLWKRKLPFNEKGIRD